MTPSESRLKYQPKYKIGQVVRVEIKTEDKATGFIFKNQVQAIISTIRASGTSESDTYEYGVTTDLPRCYHNGNPPFAYILENKIVLAENPELP
jgi:hypothetical protein